MSCNLLAERASHQVNQTIYIMKNLLLRLSELFLIILCIGLSEMVNGQTDYESKTNEWLNSVRDTFPGINGLYVVVIREGEVFDVSSGYANADQNTPFNLQTGLYIASNTKAFVGLGMAKLISDGRISADDPITKYIDRNHFPDSIDVDNIFIRDLPGHTHGLTNDIMTFRTAYAGNAPDSLLPELLRFTSYYFHPPEKKFRYCNFSYLLSGLVIQQVTGQSWKTWLRDSLLIPAGFIQTTPFISEWSNDRLATPYVYQYPDTPLNQKRDNTMHAAGGLVTTGEEMARWLSLFINNGKIGTKQIVDSDYIELAETMLASDTGRMGPFLRFGYTYGWLIGEYNNEKLYFHFGRYTGLGCMMSFMPDKKLGVFAFVNEGTAGTYLAALLLTNVYDLLLGNERNEKVNSLIINKIYKEYETSNKIEYKIARLEDIPVKSKTTLISESYGKLHFYEHHDTMMVRMGNLESPLYQDDAPETFVLQWIPGDPEHIRIVDKEGRLKVYYEDYTIFE